MATPVLLENSFPLGLVSRRVTIEPRPSGLAHRNRGARTDLAWGHDNTLAVARQILGYDPTPPINRPALSLNAECLPSFSGQSFDQVWLLSPDYPAEFRPKIGKEVGSEDILGWQVLSVVFV